MASKCRSKPKRKKKHKCHLVNKVRGQCFQRLRGKAQYSPTGSDLHIPHDDIILIKDYSSCGRNHTQMKKRTPLFHGRACLVLPAQLWD